MDDVKTTLELLMRLQDNGSTRARVTAELTEIPGHIAAIEATLAGAKKELADAKLELEDAAKRRRELEKGIEEIKAKISRYQDQLMGVKTNQEYKALNKEISTERAKIDSNEEGILVVMERSDELAAMVGERESALAGEEDRVAAEKRELSDKAGRLEKDLAALESDGEEIEKALPKTAATLFSRLVASREGVAVSRLDFEMCISCGVRARPQPAMEARTHQRLVQCESCSRIFYPLPTPVEEAADNPSS